MSVLLPDAYYFDDLTFVPGAAPAPAPAPVISFDESTPPVLTGFGGAEDSVVVADPTNTANKVARIVKAAACRCGRAPRVQQGQPVDRHDRLQREQPDDDRARSRRNAGRPLAASPGIAAFFLAGSGAASLPSRRRHRASVDLLRPI